MPMLKMIPRAAADLVILVGLFLLVKTFYNAATGSSTVQLFATSPGSWTKHVFALGLSLPLPFHVISVGLILQRRWLSPRWKKISWVAVLVSGCWLGVALAIKLLIK
jgi:succinate dehydrogenase/fumarate reductase cytochrome b subunit